MADISSEELKTEIEKLLKNANLKTTTTKKVRQQLEKILDADLISRKEEIDQIVMDYVDNKTDEEEEEEAASSEEEKKKPAKRAPPPKAAKKRKETSEEDGTNDSESEEEKKPPPKKKGKKKKGSDSDDDWGKKGGKAKKGGRGKGSGYTKAYKLSPSLSELMGAEEMPRHEVVKRVWAIIKERNLYDKNNKQFAICDDDLYKVFGTKRFRTFGMMKYLKTHFLDE